jgi:hypothetical protein
VLFSIAIPREVVVSDLLLTLRLIAGRFGSMIVTPNGINQVFVNTIVPVVDGEAAFRIADAGKTTIFIVSICQRLEAALKK